MLYPLSKRKGVSPVISALLLIVIVVAAFTGVYFWSLWQFQTYKFELERSYKEAMQAAQENLVVEFAWIDNNGRIKAYLRNAGEIEACVMDVFFNDTLLERDLHLCILPGEGAWLNTTNTVQGDYGRLKIVTERHLFIEVEVWVVPNG